MGERTFKTAFEEAIPGKTSDAAIPQGTIMYKEGIQGATVFGVKSISLEDVNTHSVPQGSPPVYTPGTVIEFMGLGEISIEVTRQGLTAEDVNSIRETVLKITENAQLHETLRQALQVAQTTRERLASISHIRFEGECAQEIGKQLKEATDNLSSSEVELNGSRSKLAIEYLGLAQEASGKDMIFMRHPHGSLVFNPSTAGQH